MHRLLPALLVLALALAGCTTVTQATGAVTPDRVGAADGDGDLTIVATTGMLADVTAQVAGDDAQVITLMDAGADPHTFEASATQLALMQQADLIVANGANLEEHLGGPLADAARAGVPIFRATEHAETLTFDHDHDHEEQPHTSEGDHDDEQPHTSEREDHADHDTAGGSVDPHLWTDPTRMIDVVHALGARVGELSGAQDAAARRADRYAARLERVDGQIAQRLAAIGEDRRTLVTNHAALNYFADRYGFEVAGTVIPSLSTGAEPSARDLERLAQTISRQQVPAVFIENTAPRRLAETLANEVGDVAVVELYSESLGEPGSGAETYIGVLRTNAERIHDALIG